MKNIVITGSTRGIGLAMAVEFLKTGSQVTLSGRKEELAPSVREKLKEFETRYHYISCDVTEKKVWRISTKNLLNNGAVWISGSTTQGETRPICSPGKPEKNIQTA